MTTDRADGAQALPEEPLRRLRVREGGRRRGGVAFLRDVAVIVVIALAASFLIKTFLVRSFYIPTGSMLNTLQINDRILVDEITPRLTGYQHGDVIVFRDPGGWLDPAPPHAPLSPAVAAVDWLLSLVGLSASDSDDHLIKRVIGLPGDRVACCNALGQLTVNGVPVDETGYLDLPSGAPASALAFDVTVPRGSLWVLGDNRNNSKDSRYNQNQPGKGFVPIDNVVGRAFWITWPLANFGPIDTHHAVFAGVPAATPGP